ncbi:MAG: NAD-dependent protein deacylase [Nannocystaceae bacterium]
MTGDAPPAATIARFAAMVAAARRALFITGAGISADSGMPTYRGMGGLYEAQLTDEGVAIEDALSGEMLARAPALCWKYIHVIEAASRRAEPNAAHEVIAWLQSRLDVWVLTQNVDGLHRRAGSRQLIEIHGDVHGLSCTACAFRQRVDDYAALAPVPHCPHCGAIVRPDVVLFGEALPGESVAQLRQELARGFDLVVSIGTTSVFPYIAAPVLQARARGNATVEVNPGQSAVSAAVELRIVARAAATMAALRQSLSGPAAAG